MVDDINDVYQSNSENMKAADIGDSMWTLTIKSYTVKEFDDGSKKIVLSFNEWEKTLVLNVTNARAIEALYGRNPNGWAGHQIMVMTHTVTYNGQQTLGIKVRGPAAPQSVPRQPGQLQPQAATNMGASNVATNSPQRPLNPQPAPAGAQPFAPLPDDTIPFAPEFRG